MRKRKRAFMQLAPPGQRLSNFAEGSQPCDQQHDALGGVIRAAQLIDVDQTEHGGTGEKTG